MAAETPVSRWVAAVVVFALLLAGQWAAAAAAPSAGVADTGRVLGRAGFAYLSGIRTFAAATLWNRLDPQFHEYYHDRQLRDLDFMMPTMRLVVALDPQFTQAYQVSSYIIFRKVGEDQGLEIAREGVANNPNSGIMHSNLAQLLLIHDPEGSRREALQSVSAGLAPGIVWPSEEVEYEGLATMRGVLVALEAPEAVPGMEARLERLRSHGAEIGDHDHDGDGKQDH